MLTVIKLTALFFHLGLMIAKIIIISYWKYREVRPDRTTNNNDVHLFCLCFIHSYRLVIIFAFIAIANSNIIIMYPFIMTAFPYIAIKYVHNFTYMHYALKAGQCLQHSHLLFFFFSYINVHKYFVLLIEISSQREWVESSCFIYLKWPC